jgi:hypothetical protein
MSSNLCSRGVYGCRHDEGHIPTKERVLKYFADHDGYVVSRRMHDHFGCCTEERTQALTSVLSHLQHVTQEIKPISASAWGRVGSDHPKVQKQQQLISKELTTGKVHLVEDGVMIHDRDGALLFEYATTEDSDEVTCGLCKNILRSRKEKLERR